MLELCLKSVQADILNLEAQLIVVDTPSTDESCPMVKSLFPEVILIENKVNYGFSKGNNQGVAHAKGEYICILNPDVVVAENTFEALLNYAETKKNSGIIGCRLIDGSGNFLPESKRNIPLSRIALNKLMGYPKHYYANQIEEFEIGKVPIFVGAFMLMKRDVFNQVKGFDEDYFMYGEDIDLSYKIHKLGYDNLYIGSITVIHFKGESTLKDKHYAQRFYGAMQIFYKKHFKSNFLYNTMVWTGIRVAYLFRAIPKIVEHKTERYVLVSDKIPNGLEHILKKPIQLGLDLESVNEHTEIILDANILSYKKIIDYISDSKLNSKAKFKILPKNSNFIIGSNNSKSRGEVIIFKNN
jgi:GT2 family glycosyltransferase